MHFSAYPKRCMGKEGTNQNKLFTTHFTGLSYTVCILKIGPIVRRQKGLKSASEASYGKISSQMWVKQETCYRRSESNLKMVVLVYF